MILCSRVVLDKLIEPHLVKNIPIKWTLLTKHITAPYIKP